MNVSGRCSNLRTDNQVYGEISTRLVRTGQLGRLGKWSDSGVFLESGVCGGEFNKSLVMFEVGVGVRPIDGGGNEYVFVYQTILRRENLKICSGGLSV